MASGCDNEKESLSSVPKPACAASGWVRVHFPPRGCSGMKSGFVLMIQRSFFVAGQGLDAARASPAPQAGKLGGDPKEFSRPCDIPNFQSSPGGLEFPVGGTSAFHS